MHRSEGRSDAVVDLAIENVGRYRVTVMRIRVAYLRGDDVLRVDRPGPALIRDDGGSKPVRLDRGSRAQSAVVCLDSVPESADTVRFEFDLSVRRRLRTGSRTVSVEVGLRNAPAPKRIRLPFDGYWRVSQGHRCSSGHRVGRLGGGYAWDFEALGSDGRSVREEYKVSRRNEDTYSFGQPVLSPADARVIRVVDDVPDNEGLRDYPRRDLLEDLKSLEWALGNFVVLRMEDGVYALLAHLERGSVSVGAGDRVRAGERIARCGNSGYSVVPHLHLQLMSRPDPVDREVEGLPGEFVDYMEYTLVRDGPPKDFLLRRVRAGDPQEGTVVGSVKPGEDPFPERPRLP